MATTETSLARFLDRHTIVYERTYPHDIGLVWEAVSSGEHLDVWMLPESHVERRVGGRCAFGWGGPADDPGSSVGEVTVFEPPTAIQFTFDDGSYMRFDLAADGATTALAFTLHFLPPTVAVDEDPDEFPGADLPAGPGTAWKPGFVAGYHELLDDLTAYLRGEWTADDRAAHLAGAEHERHARWIEVYRTHIATECPSA